MWGRVWQEIKDILFPIFCEECGVEGEWWCKNCREKNKNKPMITGADGELDFTAAFLVYQEDGVVGKLIKQFKYSFAFDLEKLWREIFKETELEKIILDNFSNEEITVKLDTKYLQGNYTELFSKEKTALKDSYTLQLKPWEYKIWVKN